MTIGPIVTIGQAGPVLRIYRDKEIVAEFKGQSLIYLSRVALQAFVEGQRDG